MKEAAPAWCSLCFTSIKTLRRRLYTLAWPWPSAYECSLCKVIFFAY